MRRAGREERLTNSKKVFYFVTPEVYVGILRHNPLTPVVALSHRFVRTERFSPPVSHRFVTTGPLSTVPGHANSFFLGIASSQPSPSGEVSFGYYFCLAHFWYQVHIGRTSNVSFRIFTTLSRFLHHLLRSSILREGGVPLI